MSIGLKLVGILIALFFAVMGVMGIFSAYSAECPSIETPPELSFISSFEPILCQFSSPGRLIVFMLSLSAIFAGSMGFISSLVRIFSSAE